MEPRNEINIVICNITLTTLSYERSKSLGNKKKRQTKGLPDNDEGSALSKHLEIG